MKKVITLVFSVILIFLTACGLNGGPSGEEQTIGTSESTTQGEHLESSTPEKNDALESIPLLYCDFSDKTISTGEWNTVTNEIILSDSPIGSTIDPYTLYSLRWDGEENISGLEIYLQEVNTFSDPVSLLPLIYGEICNADMSVYISDEGSLMMKIGDRTMGILGANIEIDGLGKVEPAMMSGKSLLVDGDTAYYLQSIMGESGIYIICTTIDIKSGVAESQLVSGSPYAYDDIDIENFSQDVFSASKDHFYFCLKNAVCSIDPKTMQVSKVVALEDLPLTSDGAATTFQITNIAVYDDNIIVECAEYITDIPSSKSSHLCSMDGKNIQTIKWNSNRELIIFPKL